MQRERIEGNRIYDYLFISDVRYNDYPEDEVYWIKEELKGALVHISQYEVKEVTSKKEWPKTEEGRVFREPANKEEARNDPKVKESADYRLEWEYIHKNHPNFINKDKYLNNKIVSFIEWLDTR